MATVPTGIPEIKIGDWLRDGWEVFVSDVGMFLLASLIYNAIMFTCLGGLILFGPLTCGFFIMIFDRMRGGKPDIRRLFEGFNIFGESFLAGFIFFLLLLVCSVIMYFGFALCVIPSLIGIALMVLLETAFLFTFQLIVEQRLDGAEAISKSFNKVKENFGQFLVFGLVLWLINAAGYCVVLGWLVTTPLTLAAAAAAYRDIFGLPGSPLEQAQASI
ncbi:MAG: hypothetical protein C4532_06880 [Candidatus Abyssobacteria bacterium SURF_17]|uniref:DUF975 family protein n=1 Tax=Candidatus Abyssobacteria bacterium SURF_17 TaxID=2093361 RepID=A0A419F1B1_9BACT|nr:MAG: hypothetical protein C4532_06880 [Candidatus Abyssubacteria bacterium SURF_17]